MSEETVNIPLSMYNAMAHKPVDMAPWVAVLIGIALGIALTHWWFAKEDFIK